MTKKWVPVPNCQLEEGKIYKLGKHAGMLKLLVEVEEPEWVDVTDECQIRHESSQRNNGIFARLMHGETNIAYFSPIHEAIFKHTDEYRIELAYGATISFRVFKLRK